MQHRMWLEEFENIEAIDERHLQIQKQQIRQRFPSAIFESVICGQKIDYLLTVHDMRKGDLQPGLLNCQLDEQKVIAIVISHQNVWGMLRRTIHRSSRQPRVCCLNCSAP